MHPKLWLKSQPKNRLIPFGERYKPSTEAERLTTQRKRNQLRLARWKYHYIMEVAA